ncbi:hypothetical protein F4778DRAFT_770959 [Xylariomycetidae sp. FL2044]|nr:hypothetical protein F4778DRAFT_770959 [Xylariomycetidae sp. FL2044]
MAANSPKNKQPKARLFSPSKFKGFVNDMKRTFTRDHIHRHRRGVQSEQLMPSRIANPEPFEFPRPPQTSAGPRIDEEQSFAPRSPLGSNLSVQLTLSFGEPLNYSYSRNYDASQSLQVTDELLEGLLRRIDHCSSELITRKDSSALDRTAAVDGTAKPLRYEIEASIIRGGSEVWATRNFKSYQRQPLAGDTAREVILATHSIIGLFFRHHDDAFVWKDGPVRDNPSEELEFFPYRPGRVQPMSCIPRSYFLEKPQHFERLPAYSISVSFTSRNSRRKPPVWQRSVHLGSALSTPLNSVGAESVFFDASCALENVFRSERKAFEDAHKACISSDGCKSCRQHESDGLELKLTVANNFGCQFEPMERNIRAKSNMFSEVRNCVDFVNKLEAALGEVRDTSDSTISHLNDLEFRIIELRGRGWALDEALLFILDSATCRSRRETEAIMDRIQTGVADILRGNAIAVRMTAYKRGHFILDKTLVAREPFEQTENRKSKSPRKSKQYVLERLRRRIQQDIDVLCRDTCSIADLLPAEPENIAQAPNAATIPEEGESTRPVSRDTTMDNIDTSSSIAAAESETTREEEQESSRSSRCSSPTMMRKHIASIRDPETGARMFPLTPSPGHHEEARMNPFEGHLQPAADISSTDEQLNSAREQTGPASDASDGTPEISSQGTATIATPTQDKDRVFATSSAPPTPSLVFSGGNSPRSSLLVTPKVQGTISSPDTKVKDSSETLMPVRNQGTPKEQDLPAESALQNPDGQFSIGYTETDVADGDPTMDHTENEAGNKLEDNETAPSLSGQSGDEVRLATEDKSEASSQLAVLPSIERDEQERGPQFSQSKQDFEFSSPPTVTPGNSDGGGDQHPAAEEGVREISPDPSEIDFESSPSPRSLMTMQHHRKSFGSAGYLGFHDQRWGELNLRRALVGSPPNSMLGDDKRPGTAK